MRAFIFFILLFASESLLYAANPKKANIIAYDQLAKPGEKIYLMARLRGGGFLLRPEIGGERIEFFRSINKSKKSLGLTLTGGNGVAVKEIPPLKIGVHTFTARLAETRRYTAEESKGIVACWDPKTPIIIVDMDALSEIERIDILFRKIEKRPKPLKDSPQVLRRLSKDYNIVYLTKEDELSLKKTRLWLRENRFPIGPLFSVEAGEEFIAEEYAEKIKEWKGEGWNIKIGIGDKPQHAEAYLENGMKAIILEGEEDLPEKAITVKGWKEIERRVLKLLKSHKSID